MTRARKSSRIEVPAEMSYLPLVAKKARQTWLKLPPQTRCHLSVEDLLQDGLIFARFRVARYWNPDKAAWITFLWWSLDNYYKGVLARHFATCRFDGRTCGLGSVLFSLREFSRVEQELSAIQSATKVYRNGSLLLRAYMLRWFHPAYRDKLYTVGGPFTKAVNELQDLGPRYGFGPPEFETLLADEGVCLRLPFCLPQTVKYSVYHRAR